jgi:hypothetical protein
MTNINSGSWVALLVALIVCVAPAGAADAQQQSAPSTKTLTAWRRSSVNAPRPTRQGCFRLDYPNTAWTPTKCLIPPNIPFRPRHGASRGLQTVGDGTDFSAQVSGTAVTMEGSFDSVTGVTSEVGAGVANEYTLQLNSEFFPTTTCNGAQSGCQGWEQFIFFNADTPSQSFAFIQYWMLDYGATCPRGWTSDGAADCYRNSVNAAVAPVQTIATLGDVTLTGVAPAGTTDDSVTVSTGTTLYSVIGNAYFPDLAQHWNTSEFNILGPGNGSQAVFNTGATMVLRTAVNSGTAPASCLEEGFTAETNNLTLEAVTVAQEEAEWPSILFTQSNTGTPTPASCVGLAAVSAPTIDSDGPIPLWALMALGAALIGIAEHSIRGRRAIHRA